MSSAVDQQKIGLWIVGARGNVASTVALGLAALARDPARSVGLTTERAPLAELPLAVAADFVLGGHDLRDEPVLSVLERLSQQDRTIDPSLVASCHDDVMRYEEEIVAGANESSHWPRLAEDMGRFRDSAGCDVLVVVNLASTEALAPELPETPDELRAALDAGELPMSCAYAMAAAEAGASYINFTPSTGASAAVFDELFASKGRVHCGRDGKTGETLLKAALLPMFASRNLEVLSWFGQNILGNGDGVTLRDPASKSAKQSSKSQLVPGVLGYEPESHVGIDYVGSLGDWKVAWDHIQFRGFLGTEMNLQLTWRGADSILAAPLVIDLARLCAFCQARGDRGLLDALGFYFKDPLGSDEHRLSEQYQALVRFLCEGAAP